MFSKLLLESFSSSSRVNERGESTEEHVNNVMSMSTTNIPTQMMRIIVMCQIKGERRKWEEVAKDEDDKKIFDI